MGPQYLPGGLHTFARTQSRYCRTDVGEISIPKRETRHPSGGGSIIIASLRDCIGSGRRSAQDAIDAATTNNTREFTHGPLGMSLLIFPCWPLSHGMLSGFQRNFLESSVLSAITEPGSAEESTTPAKPPSVWWPHSCAAT